MSESLPTIRTDLLQQFGIDFPAHQDVEDVYRYLLAFAGKMCPAGPIVAHWLCALEVHKVYYDSNGESPSCKKRKREIKEGKKSCRVVALCNDDSKDPIFW